MVVFEIVDKIDEGNNEDEEEIYNLWSLEKNALYNACEKGHLDISR